MNFLAHAYLSFNDTDILAGNMISDFVKGKKQYDYPARIQKGIRLHRSIDTYTDEHPATAGIKEFFRPAYRLYSGAFTDIVYDYFLANDIAEFPSAEFLKSFSLDIYKKLDKNLQILPAEFQTIFPYMQQHNWLYNYRTEAGIMKSFNGMASRSTYITETTTAFSIFINNRTAMLKYYRQFFPMLKNHAHDILQQLLNSD